MNKNRDLGIPVPDCMDQNVSDKGSRECRVILVS